ncbi:hypothetical protein [Duganella levis]|uniref:Uncharacterized protein n=1 Tax=Duganella levis TaxID=2692169 RepID=A0ABW9W750_9BURK|nr:hypothetical protein [Duganella levis]MYN29813.1 hypothetical protein [Duganella levis]
MQDDSTYFDTHFDAGFEAAGMAWLPWIGSGFRASASRTIVLGESIYDYSNGDAAKRQAILQKDSLRRRHLSHGIHEQYKSRYLRNFARAFFIKRKVSRTERELLWQQVAYLNLVPRMMASLRERPGEQDYRDGWKILLTIAGLIAARRCIVYGLEGAKIAALSAALPPGALLVERRLPAVGRNRPLRLTVKIGDRPLDILFIRHPSAFFRWDEWGVVMRQFLAETSAAPAFKD